MQTKRMPRRQDSRSLLSVRNVLAGEDMRKLRARGRKKKESSPDEAADEMISQGQQEGMIVEQPRHASLKAPKGTSLFAWFFETLEDRCELPIRSIGYYWMKQVRLQMTEARTWPTGKAQFSIFVVIEYVRRLMTVFWDSVGWHDFSDHNTIERFLRYGPDERRRRHYVFYKTFQVIYTRIRRWGVSGHKFYLNEWHKDFASVNTAHGGICWDIGNRELLHHFRTYGRYQFLWPFGYNKPILYYLPRS